MDLLSELMHEDLVFLTDRSGAPAGVWSVVVSCVRFCMSLSSGSATSKAVLVVRTMLNAFLLISGTIRIE